MTPARAEVLDVHAAGSLKPVLEALVAGFKGTAPDDQVRLSFGPSGKLRERIEQGARPDLFFSAAREHAEGVVKAGKMGRALPWVSNSLCLAARPGFDPDSREPIALMLDPAVRIGTSTPGADPAGDYTWEMFRRVDRLQPGSFATLTGKAQQLTGAQITQLQQLPYATLLAEGKVDLFITYCTNAAEAASRVPGIRSRPLPASIDVPAHYGIAVAEPASRLAQEFLRAVQGGRGRQMLSRFGFGLPAEDCSAQPERVQGALKAWQAGAGTFIDAAVAPALGTQDPDLPLGRAVQVRLQPDQNLSFARPALRPGETGSGGAVRVRVDQPGHYEVFVDGRAWIDLVDPQGRALHSIRSERWLGCAGVNKNLGFTVTAAGQHRLQVSQAEVPRITVLLIPLP